MFRCSGCEGVRVFRCSICMFDVWSDVFGFGAWCMVGCVRLLMCSSIQFSFSSHSVLVLTSVLICSCSLLVFRCTPLTSCAFCTPASICLHMYICFGVSVCFRLSADVLSGCVRLMCSAAPVAF